MSLLCLFRSLEGYSGCDVWDRENINFFIIFILYFWVVNELSMRKWVLNL